jgi:hypothetical protein
MLQNLLDDANNGKSQTFKKRENTNYLVYIQDRDRVTAFCEQLRHGNDVCTVLEVGHG